MSKAVRHSCRTLAVCVKAFLWLLQSNLRAAECVTALWSCLLVIRWLHAFWPQEPRRSQPLTQATLDFRCRPFQLRARFAPSRRRLAAIPASRTVCVMCVSLRLSLRLIPDIRPAQLPIASVTASRPRLPLCYRPLWLSTPQPTPAL